MARFNHRISGHILTLLALMNFWLVQIIGLVGFWLIFCVKISIASYGMQAEHNSSDAFSLLLPVDFKIPFFHLSQNHKNYGTG
jgi:hypothetical protein